MNLASSWEYILETARRRLAHNKTRRHVACYGEEIEVIGAAGELAARRFLQLPETLATHFDGGADLVWADRRVDVKATRLTPKVHHRFLQWPTWKEIKSDIILLTAVDLVNYTVEILGFALRSDIIAAPVNASRRIPCHEIPVTQLQNPWSLWRYDEQITHTTAGH